MNKIFSILIAAGVAGLMSTAVAQDPNPPGENLPPPPPPEALGEPAPASGPVERVPAPAPAESAVILPAAGKPAPTETVTSAFLPPAQRMGTNENDLNLNFRNAPLDMVLNYLSDAAGFIIVQDTRVNGSVSVVGKHLTRDEAADLLNGVLNKNGYAAIRNGRTLTIVDKNEAKTRDIPVKSGNIPEGIPKNAEIVTQIIPIRFVEARQLVSDLTSFVSPQATVVANEAGNSIVITDTQANIRHLTEIIKAVDDSAQSETEIRVFRMKYANPADVANELGSIFPSSTSGNNAQSPTRFGGGGPGGFFARMMGGGGGGGTPAASGSSASSDRLKKATQVTAVADLRIQAVIVTAPKDLIGEIAGMMKDLDVPSDRDQDVYVFQMKNGDPQQAVQVLQNMFQSSSSTRSSTGSSQNSALQQRSQNATTSMGSTTTSSGIGGSTGSSGGGRTQF